MYPAATVKTTVHTQASSHMGAGRWQQPRPRNRSLYVSGSRVYSDTASSTDSTFILYLFKVKNRKPQQ